MKKNLKNKKGTSLVELIAVIVIMGVIAAIAIPTTLTLVQNQRRNAAVESLNVLVNGVNLYLADHVVSGGNLIAVNDGALNADLTTVSLGGTVITGTITFAIGSNNTISDVTLTNVTVNTLPFALGANAGDLTWNGTSFVLHE